MKFWPWSRPRKPVYHGDGLWQLPEQVADRDDDTGMLIPDWACHQWELFESGQCHWTADDREVCPYCYATTMAEVAGYMASVHSRADARARWHRFTKKYERKREALVSCRCDQHVNPGQAAENAARALGRYTF